MPKPQVMEEKFEQEIPDEDAENSRPLKMQLTISKSA